MNKAWERLGQALFWLCWPALCAYLYRGSRTRVLVVADGQVLLVKGWLSDGRWMLPGGGLHHGESAQAGALREVTEETGVTLSQGDMTALGEGRFRSAGLSSYLHFFVCKLGAAPDLERQKGEILAAMWVPLDDIATLRCRPEVAYALKLLSER